MRIILVLGWTVSSSQLAGYGKACPNPRLPVGPQRLAPISQLERVHIVHARDTAQFIKVTHVAESIPDAIRKCEFRRTTRSLCPPVHHPGAQSRVRARAQATSANNDIYLPRKLAACGQAMAANRQQTARGKPFDVAGCRGSARKGRKLPLR